MVGRDPGPGLAPGLRPCHESSEQATVPHAGNWVPARASLGTLCVPAASPQAVPPQRLHRDCILEPTSTVTRTYFTTDSCKIPSTQSQAISGLPAFVNQLYSCRWTRDSAQSSKSAADRRFRRSPTRRRRSRAASAGPADLRPASRRLSLSSSAPERTSCVLLLARSHPLLAGRALVDGYKFGTSNRASSSDFLIF